MNTASLTTDVAVHSVSNAPSCSIDSSAWTTTDLHTRRQACGPLEFGEWMSLYASAYEEDGPAAGCAVAIVSAKGLTDTLLIWDPDDTRTSGDTPRFEDAPDPYAIYLEPVAANTVARDDGAGG